MRTERPASLEAAGQSKSPFDLASDMEDPLATIIDLLKGVFRIAETLSDSDDAGPIMRLATLAEDHCNIAQKLQEQIFHITHPCRIKEISAPLAAAIRAVDEARVEINGSDDDPSSPKIVRWCQKMKDASRIIIRHRPANIAEENLKARFLAEWTSESYLDEEEQEALIASLMPEGGVA